MTSITSIVAVGSSYVVNYNVTTTAIQIRALTVSGTTVTIGSSTSVATGSSGYTSTFAASTSVYLNFSFNAGTLAITPYTISGTTITLGSATSLGVSATYPGYKVTTISNGTRWICVYSNGAETAVSASIVSLSGANATTTTASAYTTINDIALVDLYSYGSKCLVTMGTSGVVNIITDTAGTASAGTVMTGLNGSAYPTIVSADSTYAMVVTSSSGGQYVQQVQINISGTSPTLTAQTWFGSGANTGIKAFGPCNTNGTQRACWTKGSINCSVGTIISTGVQNQKTSVVTGYGGYVFYPAFTQPGLLDGGSQMVMGYDNEIWYGGNAGISRFEGPT
jgi:hypothetical protein